MVQWVERTRNDGNSKGLQCPYRKICAQAIKQCDAQQFPNISQLLKLACTLPVTSCECERSASTLRRLSNFMRSSMGKEQLSALAMIHTHYDTIVDLDEAVDIFARLHARKLELKTLLK